MAAADHGCAGTKGDGDAGRGHGAAVTGVLEITVGATAAVAVIVVAATSAAGTTHGSSTPWPPLTLQESSAGLGVFIQDRIPLERDGLEWETTMVGTARRRSKSRLDDWNWVQYWRPLGVWNRAGRSAAE